MICVLMVAAGAAWESEVLTALADEADVTVLKRCVDVDDLLATASTGQADVALVGLDAPGLDTSAVAALRRWGVRPVAIAPSAVVTEGARVHASRLGIGATLGCDQLDGVVEALHAEPDPTLVREAEEPQSEVTATSPVPIGGWVIAVWGPAGAPGRTTVATGLACAIAQRRHPVTLVDADPWGGVVAQHLGVLDEVSGLLSAARLASSGELADRLPSVQRRVSSYLTVVSGLPRPDRWTEVRAGAVEHLAELLQPVSHVVLDTGFSLEEDPGGEFGSRPGRNSMTLGALSVADEIVVVGAADPVGLSRLARALVDLREVTGGRPVRVVVNRNRSGLGWSERDVAGMVEGFTRLTGLHHLPEDRAACDRALVAGRALSEVGEGLLVRALAEVVDGLLPGTTAATGRGARRRDRRAGRPERRAQAANSR